jgi:segregation and condensation protein B
MATTVWENSPTTAEIRRVWQRRSHVDSEIELSTPTTGKRSGKLTRLEAVLFVANEPLPARKLVSFAGLIDATEVRTLVAALNESYERCGTAFRIERVATGYRLLTRPAYSLWLGRLHPRDAEVKLSPPALETLTVLAYRQPMTRADIEAVRGVQCSEILKQLMDRGLVRLAGEDNTLGRPFLYETTRKFLELFGLRDLDDLPHAARLRRPTTGGAVHRAG